MNRFFIVCLFWMSLSASAQRPSFVYIQAEPAQPFVVTMEEQVYKSSQSGYLILSKLTDTAYAVTVSFPSTQWPSQYFTLQVNHADKGYLLKDFGDKGWGLMDWQKLTTQFSQPPVAKIQPADELKSDDDDFASLLAKASGDPSLVAPQKVNPKESSPKESVSQSTIVNDSLLKENKVNTSDSEPVLTMEEKTEQKVESIQPVLPTQEVRLPVSVVTRRAESSTTEGFGLVFVDTYANGQSDTIRLIIPNKTQSIILPPHCKELATEEQAAEFKKQLSLAGAEQEMITIAKQQLPNRCYSTEQIRTMSSLFTTDQSKYDFLLEAWSFISDKENILSLSNVFVSKEMADRFKELLQ